METDTSPDPASAPSSADTTFRADGLSQGHRWPAEARPRAALLLEGGALLAGIMLGLFFLERQYGEANVNFEQVALGAATFDAPRAHVAGAPIHCDGFGLPEDAHSGSPIKNTDSCLAGSRSRGATQVAVWLGNSQVYAINRYEPGDVTATAAIHERLLPHGLDFLTVSYPNANTQEHLATYSYVKQRVPLRTVILNLVFDDFRETGVRTRLEPALLDPLAQAVLQKSAIGTRLLQSVAIEEGPEDGAQSLQDRSEALLTDWLSAHSQLWALRPQARGEMLGALYRFRNVVFNINPQSIRSVVPVRYATNRAALEAILTDGAASNIKVLGYIAPLRNDVAPPYDPTEYRRFIQDMHALFAAHGGVLRNLEDLVPAEYWGMKDSTSLSEETELDFMHFTVDGHRLVADALTDFIVEAGLPK